MFGRKKMYKKGLQDAMHAYEKFGEKQEKALEQIREEIKAGNKKIEDMLTLFGEDINQVYDFLTAKEKEALYNLCTPIDIAELGDEEKRLLLAVLYQLADDEGSAVLNDNQRKYIRSVQRYLKITNPQTSISLAVIENIDSLEIQKVFLQVVLEFLYLQDSDELTDEQEEFLGYFSLNMKQAQAIELNVSKIYNAVGAEGVCEKYGYEIMLEDNEELVTDKQENRYETNAIYNPLERVGTKMPDGIYIWEKDKFQDRQRIDNGNTHTPYVLGMTHNLVTFGYNLLKREFYYVDLRTGEVNAICFEERQDVSFLSSPFTCENHILVKNGRRGEEIIVYDKTGKIVNRKQLSDVKCFFENNESVFVLREIKGNDLLRSTEHYELYAFNDETAKIDYLCECSNFFFEEDFIYYSDESDENKQALDGKFEFYRLNMNTGKKELLHTYCTSAYCPQIELTLGVFGEEGGMYKKGDHIFFEYQSQGEKFSEKFKVE